MEPVLKINPGATKWDIREKVWDYIEAKNLANFPRPVHNRIPNFKGAHTACAKVSDLQVFTKTSGVKVDPDKPLEGVRLAVLQTRKTLLVPTPRLRTGLFNKIVPPEGASKEELRICSTSQGVKEFSKPVGLDSKVHVDLVVVGSVAVSEKGYRIGKGEGFADLEYGMMVSMGAVSESTVVVTIVHDCQIVDIPEELMESHDLTVDYILTPTRVIKTDCQRPKPSGIIWAKLNTDMLERIPILKKLRALEEEAGKDVTLGPNPPKEAKESAAPGRRDRPRRDRGDREPRPRDDDQRPRREPRRRPRRDNQQDGGDGDHRQDPLRETRGEPDQKPRRRPPRVRKESRGEDRDGREDGRGDTREGGRGRGRRQGGERREREERGGEEGSSGEPRERRAPLSVTTVYLGGIPAGLRVSELKSALREREAAPLRLTWQGAQHRAFLDYCDPQAADQALEALQGLSLNGHSLQAEMAKSQRGGRRPGPANRRPRPSGPKTSRSNPPENASEAHEET